MNRSSDPITVVNTMAMSSHQRSCLAPDDIADTSCQRRRPWTRPKCPLGIWPNNTLCRSGTFLRRTGQGEGYETSGQGHPCDLLDLDERDVRQRSLKSQSVVAGRGAGIGSCQVFTRTIRLDYRGEGQLIVGAFAKALKIIPRQLCNNAGFCPNNILAALRRKHYLVC